VDFVSVRLSEGMELLKIVEEMFEFCVSADPRTTGGIGGDNMTCLIIRLNLDTPPTSSSGTGK
jgi:protein phosphatase 1G